MKHCNRTMDMFGKPEPSRMKKLIPCVRDPRFYEAWQMHKAGTSKAAIARLYKWKIDAVNSILWEIDTKLELGHQDFMDMDGTIYRRCVLQFDIKNLDELRAAVEEGRIYPGVRKDSEWGPMLSGVGRVTYKALCQYLGIRPPGQRPTAFEDILKIKKVRRAKEYLESWGFEVNVPHGT